MPSQNIPHTTEHRRMEASFPSDASFHTLSLINKQIVLPVAPGRYFNETNQEWASPMFK